MSTMVTQMRFELVLPPAPWLTRQSADGATLGPKIEKKKEPNAFDPFRWLKQLNVTPEHFYMHVMAALSE